MYYRRCELLAEYMLKNNSTVRNTARQFGISKSTVHKDLSKKLRDVNYTLWSQVNKLMQENKAQRHIRGGEATKIKYRKMRINNI